jgi:hypothetical protein
MSPESLFKTTTSADAPFDGSAVRGAAAGDTVSVSGFLTVQALTNFAAMTGAITAAWHALILLDATRFSGLWVPYTFAAIFGLVSMLISIDAFKEGGKWNWRKVIVASFVAIINVLVLAGAVVGMGLATRPNGS